MDYDAVAQLYITPEVETAPLAPVSDSAARRLRDAIEPIATQGWWSRAVHERLAARGLGFFEAYVWGRAAALGEPAAAVVVSAFGVFEPAFLSSVYEQARGLISRADILAAREEGAVETLRAALGDADVEPLADALLEAVGPLDGTARPLFSGLRALPVPADPHGRLWRATELFREHRGDGHLAACVAAGLDPVSMNVLTELFTGYPPGEYTATRGYDEQAIAASVEALGRRGWVADGRLTDAGLEARQAIEAATDVAQEALIARLGDRIEQLIAWAEPLAERVLAAASFPTDPRKRAAG